MSNIYHIKVQLAHIAKPPVWREILVEADTNLYLLHCCIQGAMGWFNTHLHQFIVGGQFYGIPHPDFGDDLEDARKVSLKKVLKKPKDTIQYEYDFGDDWLHVISLVDIVSAEAGKKYPLLLKGKGACPPEDCGGSYGYESLKDIVKNPKHEEYEEMTDWLGDDFDPNEFDLAEHQTAMVESYKEGVLNKGKELLG